MRFLEPVSGVVQGDVVPAGPLPEDAGQIQNRGGLCCSACQQTGRPRFTVRRNAPHRGSGFREWDRLLRSLEPVLTALLPDHQRADHDRTATVWRTKGFTRRSKKMCNM